MRVKANGNDGGMNRAEEKAKERSAREEAAAPPCGLYVHVPFCVRRCVYCDFASNIYSAAAAARWLAAVERELTARLETWPDFMPVTVFLGGGTPSVLSADELYCLPNILRRLVDFSRVKEFTWEVNPGTLDAAKTQCAHAAGLNRVSIGAQSFRPSLLKLLGRAHGAEDIYAAVSLLRAAGFDNLSLDLLYGFVGRTRDNLDRDLEEAFTLEPEHLSAYGVSVEPGSPPARAVARGKFALSSAEDYAVQYRLVRERCAAAGLPRYEISNYARPGREARHNLLYWRGGNWLGLGPSAASSFDGERQVNARDLEEYLQRVERDGTAVVERERLSGEKRAREALVLELRLRRGVAADEFVERWGWDFRQGESRAALKRHLRSGFMEYTAEGRVRLSDRALIVADSILSDFV